MHELLSPAGDFLSLRQAVINGCDAVYIGGLKFGARKYAPNFSNEELKKAIKYCHLYNVKIYVTVNTAIYDNELQEALEYIGFLYENEVDALIMQDIGLIKLAREIYPDLEIHASTQLHNHNKEGLELLKELGIKRVVLARELSLDDIKNLDVDIEKEVFIHGALCVSYSGQCLFSSVILNRSGNRGSCAGLCRLPYELYKEDEKVTTEGNYLLSPKELNTSFKLDELLKSDIKSFKIEGRMKSPTYVGFITKFYRKIIDNYQKYQKIIIDKEDVKKLFILYNREFTDGYLFNKDNTNIMNIKSPNHQGLVIGQVIEVTSKKIKIRLDEELNQGDGIRFIENNKGGIINFLYDEKDNLINSAKSKSIVYLDNKYNIRKKGKVLKTSDVKLTELYENLVEKKIPISIKVTAKLGMPLKIKMQKGNVKIEKTSDIIKMAITSSSSAQSIEKQVTKLGNTPFICEKIEIVNDDNIFIPIKILNDLRREVASLLEEELSTKKSKKTKGQIKSYETNYPKRKITLSVLVKTEQQLKVAVSNNVDRIYTSDENLYRKYQNVENIYLKLPRVIKGNKKYQNENLLVGELGGIKRYPNNNIITDAYLNVLNHSMINYLLENKVKTITLSHELTKEDCKNIVRNYNNPPDLEVILYTRIELMIMKYCPISYSIKHNKTCNLCKNNNYYLKDRNNKKYPLITNNCLTTILNSEVTDKIDEMKDYLNMNITSFRLEFYNEDSNAVEKIISRCLKLKN